MQAIRVTGSDQRLDYTDAYGEPINPLPVSCHECGFPDLDHVPQPYAVVKSRTKTSNEIGLAAYGNLLVTERVKAVIEIVAPKECEFVPTVYRKTDEVTNWHLAVPRGFGSTGSVKPVIRRCSSCEEPISAHPGSQYDSREVWSDNDIAKARNWSSFETKCRKGLNRDSILSVRFYQLLKKIGAKGLDEATCGTETKPDTDDLQWIEGMISRLTEHGISSNAPGTLSKDESRWFRQFLKGEERNAVDFDFKAFEKQHRIRLPKSYKDFVSQLGERSFENVDDEEGNLVRVLQPDDLDLASYRQGAFDATDEESGQVDGIMFAESDHGDCYCFDLAHGKKEPPVLLFRHEGAFYEPYTNHFVEFVRRISE